MKKSLLAIAVLGAFAGAASAQSSVTISGFLDANLQKAIGSKDKAMGDSGGSRLNFKGSEDLGGGLRANFFIETRLNPKDGAQTSATTFWNGSSTVGLSGNFGSVNLGRQYTAAFSLVQNKVDPFLGDTVANLRDTGMRQGANTTIRVASSARYDYSANGVSFALSVGDQGALAKNPVSLAVSYANGPLWAGYAYEATGAEAAATAKANALGVSYDFGVAKLAAGFNFGKNTADADVKGWLVGATVPVAGGDFKVGVAQSKLDDTVLSNKASVGYHYYLSKLTEVYVDVTRDGKVAAEKMGYDAGIRVRF